MRTFYFAYLPVVWQISVRSGCLIKYQKQLTPSEGMNSGNKPPVNLLIVPPLMSWDGPQLPVADYFHAFSLPQNARSLPFFYVSPIALDLQQMAEHSYTMT